MPSNERGPGPATIEHVMAAWQRTQHMLEADAYLAGDEFVVNVGTLADAEQAEIDVEVILKRIVNAMMFAALREAEADELARAMTARKRRYEQRGESLRREILDIMMSTGRRSFDAVQGTVSVAALPGSVVISEVGDIPDEYMIEKITRTPDKRAIGADLKEGVVIPGASLSNGGFGLVFKPQRAPSETP